MHATRTGFSRSLTGLWAACVLAALFWNAQALRPVAAKASSGELTCSFNIFDEAGSYFATAEVWGTASCPTCGPISMEVNWGDGSGWGGNQVDPGPSFSASWAHPYAQPGSYQVCVEADDADGERCSYCQQVNVD
jgi:hypothetical protein